MTLSGHSKPTLLAASLGACGFAWAVLSGLQFWGFCVDDALIPIRFAQHLASGDGYVMSRGASPSDGVTPLPFAFILVPLVAHAAPFAALARVKVVMLFAHGIIGALVFRRAALVDARRRPLALFLALSFFVAVPSAAWAASGMEVELAALLVTFAVAARGRTIYARALLAGLASTLRPELGAFAVAYALALVATERGASSLASPAKRARAWLLALAAGAGPFVAVALVRVAWFGRADPLSVSAKPSDLSHGVMYLGAALVASAAPFAALSASVWRASPAARALVLACTMHFFAIAIVGGDSMPLARLMVPVAPALMLVAIEGASLASSPSLFARGTLVLAVGLWGQTHWAHDARRTLADREALARDASPWLASSHVIACVDVGWVSAAAPDATLVDLAGVTDAEIAFLSGGHTSKAIPTSLLAARRTDTLLLLEKGGLPARNVEARLLADRWITERFTKTAVLPIGSTGLAYGVYVRRADP